MQISTICPKFSFRGFTNGFTFSKGEKLSNAESKEDEVENFQSPGKKNKEKKVKVETFVETFQGAQN